MNSPVEKSAAHNEGERRKNEALSMLAERREPLVRQAQRALLERLLVAGTATADDVRDVVELPPGVDPKAFGAVPGALARAGIIRADGFEKTARPEAHARPVTRWTLANRCKAERWLSDHPPPCVGAAQEKGDAAPAASPVNETTQQGDSNDGT